MRRWKGLLLASLGLMLAAQSGCTGAARTLGSMTANKYADPQSGTVWIVPPPQLEPPAPDKKTAYISFRNISDADVDLTQQLKDAAVAQGWTLSSDPTQATYRLRASLRFFGEVEPDSGGRRVAEQMGWISGAAVGIGTGVLVANATDSWGAGAAAGVGAGGLAGIGIAIASKPREWALIVDFVLEERTDEPVEYELLTDSGSDAGTSAGVGNSRTADSGGTSTSNSRSGSTKQKSNYFPHGVRLSSWANQMNMSEKEAMPLVLQRLGKVVTQMLPQ